MSIKVESESELTKTTCPYCGVGCGIVVSKEQGEYNVRGNPDHPIKPGSNMFKGCGFN